MNLESPDENDHRLRQFYPFASCESARFFLLVYFSLGLVYFSRTGE